MLQTYCNGTETEPSSFTKSQTILGSRLLYPRNCSATGSYIGGAKFSPPTVSPLQHHQACNCGRPETCWSRALSAVGQKIHTGRKRVKVAWDELGVNHGNNHARNTRCHMNGATMQDTGMLLAACIAPVLWAQLPEPYTAACWWLHKPWFGGRSS